jgi:hypothetical protein
MIVKVVKHDNLTLQFLKFKEMIVKMIKYRGK